jgi:hypothetical protein
MAMQILWLVVGLALLPLQEIKIGREIEPLWRIVVSHVHEIVHV